MAAFGKIRCSVTLLARFLNVRLPMFRHLLWILAGLCGLAGANAAVPAETVPLEQRTWLETRTAHFNISSCGPPQSVHRLAGRLEQFCKAYSQLAGMSAVESPPIVVIAFPDHESLKPFLPLYQGRPANLAAFFQHGSEENLIVLSLPEPGAPDADMSVIFHEYSHLLFRRNDRIWPLWLKEGMAEVYATFQTSGHDIRIASPIVEHLRVLAKKPLMPLAELFGVNNDSPQYNERQRQGMFYAESWLLTHFLMSGDSARYRSGFGQFTALLRLGQLPVPAFTNAFHASLSVAETELRRYLAEGKFSPIDLSLTADISAAVAISTRALTPVEINFRLGNELLRINRGDDAETYFNRAKKIAPASPLPDEGLGLLASQREQPAAAVRHLQAAIDHGSPSFLTYYIYAREKYQSTADAKDRYARLQKTPATELRRALEQSIQLMPDFGPAHQLLGFFELVQGDNLVKAEQHLRRAIQLEPENPACLFPLAQLQLRNRNPAAARQTLEPLLRPNVEAKLRTKAAELMQEINRTSDSPF